MKTQKRYIERDVYDALELVAEMVGGVGSGAWFRHSALNEDWPVCINGFACFLGLTSEDEPLVISRIGIHTHENDTAVQELRKADLGKLDDFGIYRIPFPTYAKKLGMVRGPE